MFLYILLAIAVAFILGQAYLIYIFTNRITELSEHLATEVRAYNSLDQGMVEISDAYETDCLQYEDTIEKLHTNAKIDRIARHEQNNTIEQLRGKIVRRNETIDDLQIQLGTVRGENLHLRRELDIAQVIIAEHDLNCLPHIVLSSMEEEKDTPLPI